MGALFVHGRPKKGLGAHGERGLPWRGVGKFGILYGGSAVSLPVVAAGASGGETMRRSRRLKQGLKPPPWNESTLCWGPGREMGIEDVVGLDGPWTETEKLLIPKGLFGLHPVPKTPS
jgi:hypothetical protein